MIVLDQNIPTEERKKLDEWGIRTRKIGVDIGWAWMSDEGHIIPLLHSLRQPTFFTLDLGFYRRKFCHPNYCIVVLDISEIQVAEFVRRFMRHKDFNTKAKRMGRVVKITTDGIYWWEISATSEKKLRW